MFSKVKALIMSIKYSFRMTFKSSVKCFFIRFGIQIINGILPLLYAILYKNIINILSMSVINANTLLLKEFIVYSLYILILELFRGGITKVDEFYSQIHGDLIKKHIEIEIAKKSAFLDISYYDSADMYDELQNVRRDSPALATMTNLIFNLIMVSIRLISAFAVMITFNIYISLGIIAFYIPFALISKKQTKKIYDWTRKKVKVKRKMGYLLGLLSNKMTAKELRLYDYGEEIIDKHEDMWGKWFAERKTMLRRKIIFTQLSSILPIATIAAVSVFVGLNVINGSLTLGDFSLYGGMTAQLSAGIFGFISVLSSIYESSIKIKFLDKFMHWKNKLKPYGKLVVRDSPIIEFRNVSFKYPNMERYILKNISFIINCNEKLALVGVNGAGKTTLMKLLLRLYDPTEGEILFDGKSIKQYNLKNYRRAFSAMFQRYGSYSLTVEESIGLADLELPLEVAEERMNTALEFSGVNKILNTNGKNKKAYLSRLFHNDGIELSGGEWQKMALARTFYRDASIYILDEPSAALDPESEKEIFNKLIDICKEKTAILISHRLSNVIMADKIVVIEDGELTEQGSHNELLDLNGRYAYLFSLQADRYLKTQQGKDK